MDTITVDRTQVPFEAEVTIGTCRGQWRDVVQTLIETLARETLRFRRLLVANLTYTDGRTAPVTITGVETDEQTTRTRLVLMNGTRVFIDELDGIEV